MRVLGIESSCDETSAAVMSDGILRSSIVSSQYFHSTYGGIVPELASRAHLRSIVPIVDEALRMASMSASAIDVCAVTEGPGLIGSLLVGLNFAKAFSITQRIPLIPINHLEAHIFSPFLVEPHPQFPFVCLVVSGGHTALLLVHAVGEYTVLGSTRDDAAGEAFDKVAKLIGLGFPGGPAIEAHAKNGNPHAIQFPRGDAASCEFSFSGVKTSVLYFVRKQLPAAPSSQYGDLLSDSLRDDICASFQAAVVETLVAKTLFAAATHSIRDIAVVGGVSANGLLQRTLRVKAESNGNRIFIPPIEFSTDNAAMVAKAGALRLQHGGIEHRPVKAFARSLSFQSYAAFAP